MKERRIRELSRHLRERLLDDTISFWMRHSLDRRHGGYLTHLDRRGKPLCGDKPMWAQGRGAWIFSRLYNALEPREEWLEAARLGVEFIKKHGFADDRRMYFECTREGKPLRKRRYLFTEHFAVLGLAEYGKAAGDSQSLEMGREIMELILEYRRGGRSETPKVNPATRPLRSHSEAMIIIDTARVLRGAVGTTRYDPLVDEAIEEIFGRFVHPEKRALLEAVRPDGSVSDTPEGRTVNPGHCLETAWFVMEESRRRRDDGLLRKALVLVDWALEAGWDPEHGGIFYFTDCDGKSSERIEWDMKLWWVHCEALYATLLAHHLSGEAVYLGWFERIRHWAEERFPDPECGEWYGYLHRDGSVALDIKGNTWKGPFHLPRAQLFLHLLLDEMLGEEAATRNMHLDPESDGSP